MLEQLKITNFQAHKSLVIKLDPLVTTLVGPTDTGKSSVIRALRWLCLNKPSGNAFIRHGTDQTEVRLKVDDHVIERIRGEGKNLFVCDKHSFHAIGTGGVPDSVSKILNVEASNFALQHDAQFWFSLSAGEVSRELNTIINLGLIDQTLSNISFQLRQARSTVSITENRLAAAREQRDKLAWVKDAKEAMDGLELKQASIDEKRIKRARLAFCVQSMQSYGEQLQNASNASIGVAKVVAKGTKALELQGQVSTLRTKLETLAEAEQRASKTIPVKAIKILDKLQEEVTRCTTKKDILCSLLGQIRRMEFSTNSLTIAVTTVKKELKEQMKICPVCEKPI